MRMVPARWRRPSRSSGRTRWLGAALAVIAALAGATLLMLGLLDQKSSAPAPRADAAGVVLAPPADQTGTSGEAAQRSTATGGLPRSTPTAISIPAIGVRSGLEHLGENPDHSIEVPHSFQSAGWFTDSVTPGQTGPMVILGHVDSRSGPGVFFRLGDLRPGDLVTVPRADGQQVNYQITGVREYAKDAFPTLTVYANTPVPTIRLITCGGQFDAATGHYKSNVIAYGEAVAG
ncbi:MAG: hypothetical protein QOC98_2767 [Frankiaceae bacterium]|nr:hypothetical protein [Frankiaceae bacterium]